MPFSPPHATPLLDRASAAAQTRSVYGPQLELLRELTDYGSDLLLRCIPATKNCVPDWIVVATLFRQVVASLDCVTLCLEHGAVDASQVHARGLFEARLYLEWVLTQGKERWARQLYVATLRTRLSRARRFMPGTTEHDAFSAGWTSTFQKPPPLTAELELTARAQDAEITQLLTKPTYATINLGFDHARRGVAWHAPGPGGVNSIQAMATKLGRTADYEIYKHLSDYVHGSYVSSHSKVLGGGQVLLEPIRSAEHFAQVFPFACAWATDAFRRMTDEYRSGERDKLQEKYEQEWKPRLSLPSVTITTAPVEF